MSAEPTQATDISPEEWERLERHYATHCTKHGHCGGCRHFSPGEALINLNLEGNGELTNKLSAVQLDDVPEPFHRLVYWGDCHRFPPKFPAEVFSDEFIEENTVEPYDMQWPSVDGMQWCGEFAPQELEVTLRMLRGERRMNIYANDGVPRP